MVRNLPFRAAPRRRSFGAALALLVGGGFAGALAALQLMPVKQASAGTDAVPVRVVAAYAVPRDALRARFAFCHAGGGTNCVVDGDTFWLGGEKIRIADIDTPETHPARCDEEQRLGDQATARLQGWLNEGAFTLASNGRDTDRYGRKLRIATRGGTSVGDVLVSEGLARRWEGSRRPWC